MDIVRYIRRRWLTIKQDDGFAGLEGWAVKEIASGKSDSNSYPVTD